MMERRAFVGGLGALVAVPLAAAAQEGDKVRRVGWRATNSGLSY